MDEKLLLKKNESGNESRHLNPHLGSHEIFETSQRAKERICGRALIHALMMMTELIVKELTPSLRDDFLLFFDHVAFADNPDWSDCYCSAYHFANTKGKVESRRQASSLIEDDRMHGFLAYDNGKPVGWCNAASRYSYPGIHWLMGPGPDKGEKVGAIVCFVIASTHRGKGVASQLLNTACNKFSEKGFEFAEAYPVKKPPSAAYDFPGPLSMYLKNGFTQYRDNDWYLIVRRPLKPKI